MYYLLTHTTFSLYKITKFQVCLRTVKDLITKQQQRDLERLLHLGTQINQYVFDKQFRHS